MKNKYKDFKEPAFFVYSMVVCPEMLAKLKAEDMLVSGQFQKHGYFKNQMEVLAYCHEHKIGGGIHLHYKSKEYNINNYFQRFILRHP